jgi:hypothetical protein
VLAHLPLFRHFDPIGAALSFSLRQNPMGTIMQRCLYGLLSLSLLMFALQPARAATATLESVKSPRGVSE